MALVARAPWQLAQSLAYRVAPSGVVVGGGVVVPEPEPEPPPEALDRASAMAWTSAGVREENWLIPP